MIGHEHFHHPLAIEPADIDLMGHVNNVVYLRWVQDCATAHWQAIAPPPLQQQWLWVVLRHEIDYLKAAQPDDGVFGRTWVGEADGPRFTRFVEICRADGTVLARARTVWCLIEAASLRPRRVPQEISALFAAFSAAG